MTNDISKSRRDILVLLGSGAALSLLPGNLRAENVESSIAERDIPYTVAAEPWPGLLGNQRVHLYVEKPAEAVWAYIPWRRVDMHPERKAVLVYNPDGSPVLHVAISSLSAESGDILFEAKQPGDYFLYYLPHADLKGEHSVIGPKGQYRTPQPSSESSWSRRFAVRGPAASESRRQQLPRAQVIEFQARTSLDVLSPMEVSATEDEVQDLCRRYPQSVLLFPEDREHPIQMYDKLPHRWIQNGPGSNFSATALRGEFYVFQVGIYANKNFSPSDISVRFDDLSGSNGEKVPASAWECFNTKGVDAHGRPFHKDINIAPGTIAALWCGVQIPLDAKTGKYHGNVYVDAKGMSSLPVHCDFEVIDDFIRDGGVDQPWRMSRIQWLNSTIGSEETITAPYTPLQLQDRTVTCLGRKVRFGEDGFPTSIQAGDLEVLAAPVRLQVYGKSKLVQWKSKSIVTSSEPAKILMDSVSEGGDYTLRVRTTVEFDGGIGCKVILVSRRPQLVSDIALEIPHVKDAVPYSLGMGLKGGTRPKSWQWKWSEQPQRWKDQGSNLEFFSWLGGAHAGLYCRLQSPLEDWKNGNNGSIGITETGNSVLFRASSGTKMLRAGEELNFSFRLLPTPVKPLDPQHWKYRYAQAYRSPSELQSFGTTVINLHQGTPPNLYINYPFLNLDLLVPYVSTAHALGMKVKLYYTMRELTTRLPELWAFRSLGNEIYRLGGIQGQGNPQLDFWLQEHLRENYSPGWITLTSTGDIDTSLRIYSDSRLANFYLEGLKWLLNNVPIDGLYLDEIGYPRETMQRVRRVLERRPQAMIDMHGNHDWWSCNCPIGYYMEHLPYIDRLWLGEAFDPDSPPEFWLVEMSGLPFGLSSDMLERPNPWRGMLFGMTNRALWSGPNPAPIWKLWDMFGIQDAIMIGWWEQDSPVKTGRSDVLATVYKNDGKYLVAIASWAKTATRVQLQIDWEKLGIDKKRANIAAPKIDDLQDPGSFLLDQSISVPPGKGWLLLIEDGSRIG